jgi:hypothetical protein
MKSSEQVCRIDLQELLPRNAGIADKQHLFRIEQSPEHLHATQPSRAAAFDFKPDDLVSILQLPPLFIE